MMGKSALRGLRDRMSEQKERILADIILLLMAFFGFFLLITSSSGCSFPNGFFPATTPPLASRPSYNDVVELPFWAQSDFWYLIATVGAASTSYFAGRKLSKNKAIK